MRKPGQLPFTRPAPLDEPPATPDMVENAYGVMIAEDNPVLWVRLDDEAGVEVYEKHYTGAATVNGAPVRSGVVSQGMQFDGVDDSIFIGCDVLGSYPPRLLNDAGVFSVDFLLDPDYVSVEDWTTVLRWGYYGLHVETYRFSGSDNSGYIKYTFYDEAAATYSVDYYDANLFEPGVVKHHAATYDGASFKLFVDGVLEATAAHTEIPFWGFSLTAVDGLGIATNASFGGEFYEGMIAEVAIYDSVLTEARVLEHATVDRTPSLFSQVELAGWDLPSGVDIATSTHLWWQAEGDADPSDTGRWVKASAKLTLPTAPTVEDLYYWAMQVSFYDGSGTLVGGAHTGLQWIPGYIDNKAVNWGGYDADDVILTGTESAFPSSLDNDNTRDYDWATNTEYTFEVSYVGSDYWRATVNGVTIRDLLVPGGVYIASPAIWSEIFAACDSPAHSARWRDLTLTDETDTEYEFYEMFRTFSTDIDACTNTNSSTDGEYYVVSSGTTRDTSSTYIDPRGYGRNHALYPEVDWPASSFTSIDLSYDLKMSSIPVTEWPQPYVGVELFFRDAAGTDIDSYFTIGFEYDTTLSAYKALTFNGYYYDAIGDDYPRINPTYTLPLLLDDAGDTGDWKFQYTWTQGTTYTFNLALTAAETWTLSIEGTEVLEFTVPDSASVHLYSLKASLRTNCGENRLKAGWSSISASDSVPTTVNLDSVTGYIDSGSDCSTLDFYIEDDTTFTIDTVSTPRTFPEDETGTLTLP